VAKLIPNPEYAEAPFEMRLLNQDGSPWRGAMIPKRFKLHADFLEYMKTGNLKYTVPSHIEVP
jgi:hypothetical protein